MKASRIVLSALLLGACVGPAPEAPTVGDRCLELATSYCESVVPCGDPGTLEIGDCLAIYLPFCCEGSACEAPSALVEDDVIACLDDYAERQCRVLDVDSTCRSMFPLNL